MKKHYDPRMHSAEHLLNRTMVRMFDCGRAFNAHIEKRKSKCDYAFSRDLTREEVTQLEAQVNALIHADMPVTEEYLTREETAARYDIQRLPEDTGDAVRIVHMGTYDACPCIGSHVASTGQIGHFQITSVGFTDGRLRIRFKLDN